MKKIAIIISYLLPLFIREKIAILFLLTLGKGFDFSSLKKELNLFKNLLKKKGLFLDIGGNKGKYSDLLINYFPEAKVYIFEPQKKLFYFLKKKYTNKKNIKLFNFAVSDKNKKNLFFLRHSGDPLGSLYKRNIFQKNFKMIKKESVRSVRLDKILDHKQIIDFAKIDTEGNEMKVLKGIGKLIKNFYIIQIEFGGTWIDSRYFYKDLYNFFFNNNFSLFRMSPRGLIKIIDYKEIDEYFTFTNFLAINNRKNIYNKNKEAVIYE